MKKCPFCAEEIQDEAILCRFCGRDLPQSQLPINHRIRLKRAESVMRAKTFRIVVIILLTIAWLYWLTTTQETFMAIVQTIAWLFLLAPIITIINHYIKLQQWNGVDPKPSFPWWTIILPAILCLGPILFAFIVSIVPTFHFSSTPLPHTTSYPSSVPTVLPTLTPTSPVVLEPTRTNSDCHRWTYITTDHVGTTQCVYGTVVRIENTYAYILRFKPERSNLYFVSASIWWPDLKKGDCVMARGKILLSAENVPYMNTTDGLYYCDYWMK